MLLFVYFPSKVVLSYSTYMYKYIYKKTVDIPCYKHKINRLHKY